MSNFGFVDVNEALPVMWQCAHDPSMTFTRDSRNGPVREFHSPVMIKYRRPRQRVLFHEARAANPFFHFFEALWMLAGRDDVAWISRFLPRMKEYSDDGKKFHGAYGKRWFTANALMYTIQKLRADPNSRRAYLPIGDAKLDANYAGKDQPCNVGAAFYVRDDTLDMTVFNRSNDLILGSLGANYVHFGFLQEFVADMLGVDVGMYCQISSCLHLYEEQESTERLREALPDHSGPTYASLNVRPWPHRMLSNPGSYVQWSGDLHNFLDVYTNPKREPDSKVFWFEPFFHHVAAPMYRAWYYRNDPKLASVHTDAIMAEDWRWAARSWLNRRTERLELKDTA
jgi:hypothetical protein